MFQRGKYLLINPTNYSSYNSKMLTSVKSSKKSSFIVFFIFIKNADTCIFFSLKYVAEHQKSSVNIYSLLITVLYMHDDMFLLHLWRIGHTLCMYYPYLNYLANQEPLGTIRKQVYLTARFILPISNNFKIR